MRLSKVFLFIMTLAVSVGCGQQRSNSEGSLAPFDVNRYPAHKLVCDPFGGVQPGTYDQGLHARLFYLMVGKPIPHSVGEMLTSGTESANELFFSQVNVPTRLFGSGFPTEAGGLVKDDSGQPLIEYFGLRFEGGLKLTEEDEEGIYEFALLSDDGAILSYSTGESFSPLVENDGDHPTRMGCGSTLEFTRSTQHKIRLDYYQGPRYHIGLIPLWRKIHGAPISEAQCGQLGNDMYFDPDNNSNPQAAYLGLLMRGWKPIASGNYRIPASAGYNPCTESDGPVISNFAADLDSEGVLRATWTTDIPATTQVLYTDVESGVQNITPASNVLTTSHSVLLQIGIATFGFDVQAVSVSGNMGRGLSSVLRVQ